MPLSAYNPADLSPLPATSPREGRGLHLMAIAGIDPETHAGRLFAWLWAQGDVVERVPMAALRQATGGSEAGVRRWLALLESRGLIAVAHRDSRFEPRTITLLGALADPQKWFDFAKPATPAELRLCAVRTSDNEPVRGAHRDHQSVGDGDRCEVRTADERVTPKKIKKPKPVAGSDLSATAQDDDKPSRSNRRETCDAPALNQLNKSNSLHNQSLIPERLTISRDTAPAVEARPIAGALAEALNRLELTPERIDAEVDALAAWCLERLPAEVSRRKLAHACRYAITVCTADGFKPFTPADVRRIVAWSNTKPPGEVARAFHGAIAAEFNKRGWPWAEVK